MKLKLIAMFLICAIFITGLGGLAVTPVVWANEEYEDFSPIYEEYKRQMDEWFEGKRAVKPELGDIRIIKGPTMKGSFYLNGDPKNEEWFELHDDCTGAHFVANLWFEFKYEINGNQIKCKYLGEDRYWNITILDENRLQYQLTAGLPMETYTRLEGVVDDRLRRLPGEDFWHWYERLPYEEQLRILEEDMERERKSLEFQKEYEKKLAADAAAAEAAKPIILKIDGVTIKTDSPPVVENGRTLVPVRAVAEAMGYVVSWNSSTQTIEIYDFFTNDLLISMKMGSKVAKVAVGRGGKDIMDDRFLDVPARAINGRTMVPVRFMAESLGCEVKWDQKTKTINIIRTLG